jgi:hypothetical protein
MNQCPIICILNFFPGDKILAPHFLLTFSSTTFTFSQLWVLLISVHRQGKLEICLPFMSAMSQVLAFQQGESQLQTTSADI